MGRSPLVSTYWALHSTINFGMSTVAGHSRRHWWQCTHRSASRFSSSPSRSRRIQPSGEDRPHQVRLGPRRGFFARPVAEDRDTSVRRAAACGNRPQPLHIRATCSIDAASARTTAAGRGDRRGRGSPASLGHLAPAAGSRLDRPQIGRHRLRRIGHLLARVQDVLRVEKPFDLPKHVVQRPKLLLARTTIG